MTVSTGPSTSRDCQYRTPLAAVTVDTADLLWAVTGTPVDAVACHAVVGESRCHPAGSYGVDIGTGPPPRPPHHCPPSTVHCPPSTILGLCHSVTVHCPSILVPVHVWSLSCLYVCTLFTLPPPPATMPSAHPRQHGLSWEQLPATDLRCGPLPPVPTSVSLCTAGSRVIVPWRGRRGHLCALVHQDRSCPVGSSRAPIEQRKGPLWSYCRSKCEHV